MGLFGHFFSFVEKPIYRALGKTATNVLLPFIPISHIAASIGDKVLAGALTPAHVSQVPIQQRSASIPVQYQPTPPTTYQGGYGNQQQPYYYGGNSYAPTTYPQAEPFQGGSPWDFSTPSPAYSNPPSVTYSAQAPDRTWEDLALQAVPFFL